jgi:crotonobetainyl-CoA:carnitine CoA-transferase CaiB-like acyl-CoA transferase
MAAVLQGIRVLDFGRYIAGPYCGALLAEYGADVIRIEKRDGSEDRFPAQVGGGVGALFLQMNRNKRSVTLDPASPEGREVVARMVRTADVVIANLPAATLVSMGLDYDTLCSYRPDIILVTNTAFGPVGPMSKNVGFDGIGQVMSGAVYMTGQPDQPYRASAPYVDFGTALHCAFGTMAALMERSKTGKGQVVQGALLATALTINKASLIEQAVVAPNRVPTGNRGQTAAPSDIYRTRDGWVLVAVNGQPLFVRWAKLMGEAHWLTDPRFATDDDRGAHGEIISERMGRWCAERLTDDVVKILGDAKIPCAPVLTPQQSLDHPQVQALGVLQDTDYPGLPRPAPVAAVPLWMSQTAAVPRRRPPQLGEHTDEFLTELGYSAQDIAGLRERLVI